jgi:hypothetical protein
VAAILKLVVAIINLVAAMLSKSGSYTTPHQLLCHTNFSFGLSWAVTKVQLIYLTRQTINIM